MKKLLLLGTFICLAFSVTAQGKSPYTLYTKKGKKVSYKKMQRTLAKKDIVFFGEMHNNAIAHWLQMAFTKDCDQTRDLVLGAEMFEQDNQEALDRYLQGKITAKQLDSQARLWKNYPTDYAPLVNYAKANSIPFAATNIPRRYAALVARGGFAALDTLPALAKNWMAPLPMEYDPNLPGYKKMLEMMPGHGGENLPKAQASKDATMAWFILKYFQPGKLFIHFNGTYHSENGEGILWYLQKSRPELRLGSIATVVQKDTGKLEAEHRGKADFILCVEADMTTTY
ncbi:MAG: ChaN family lipoprotein [Chitinophagaceae bacterium]|nr:ChaN family lipoprotein [Chitinophagaceae bacterium]